MVKSASILGCQNETSVVIRNENDSERGIQNKDVYTKITLIYYKLNSFKQLVKISKNFIFSLSIKKVKVQTLINIISELIVSNLELIYLRMEKFLQI